MDSSIRRKKISNNHSSSKNISYNESGSQHHDSSPGRKPRKRSLCFIQKLCHNFKNLTLCRKIIVVMLFVSWKTFMITCVTGPFFLYVMRSMRQHYELEQQVKTIAETFSSSLVTNMEQSPLVEDKVENDGVSFQENNISSILHIVTSLTEYDGPRWKKGDRLMNTLVPVLLNTLECLVKDYEKVDVFLVLGYTISEERLNLVREKLPEGVGLEVWCDATPLGYDRNDFNEIQEITRSLARQHRFVIADKLEYYDFFNVWEDDMFITSEHIKYYLDVSRKIDDEIEYLKKKKKDDVMPESTSSSIADSTLTIEQLERLQPGFIRVEVLPQEINKVDNIMKINPGICCSPFHKDDIIDSNQLMTWESGILGYSLYDLSFISDINWVALQPGPADGIYRAKSIQGIWTGTYHDTQGNGKRPRPTDPKLFGQQGGFMATREQIVKYNKICSREFLPPFRNFGRHGLDGANVEFWSGGFQLFGAGHGGCGIQRILVLNTSEEFSHHLIYHTANNKQHRRDIKVQQRQVKVDDLYRDLRKVRDKIIQVRQK